MTKTWSNPAIESLDINETLKNSPGPHWDGQGNANANPPHGCGPDCPICNEVFPPDTPGS